MRLTAPRREIVLLATAAPAAAGLAAYEYCVGRGHALGGVFVGAAALAFVGSSWWFFETRRRGGFARATPAAIASVVLSASCIMISRNLFAGFVLVWVGNLAMSIVGLTLAIQADRKHVALERIREALKRDGEGQP